MKDFTDNPHHTTVADADEDVVEVEPIVDTPVKGKAKKEETVE